MLQILKYPDIKWSMPFLFCNDLFIPTLHNLLGNNHSIKYVYGTPNCKWAGGRISQYNIRSLKLIERIISNIISYNITPVFTFTNTNLRKDDIKDTFCNELLKIISCSNCEVIIVSNLLYNHIKEKFPDIKLVSSVINSTYSKVKAIDETEHINNLLDKFDRVVIRPEFAINKNYNFNDLKDISRIELLINQNCTPNCPNSDIHYHIFDLYNNKIINQNNYNNCIKKVCPRENNPYLSTNSLTHYQIQNCINADITNLKLQGRNFDFKSMLEELFLYFFSNNADKNKIKTRIDEIISSIIKESPELQIHSLFIK